MPGHGGARAAKANRWMTPGSRPTEAPGATPPPSGRAAHTGRGRGVRLPIINSNNADRGPWSQTAEQARPGAGRLAEGRSGHLKEHPGAEEQWQNSGNRIMGQANRRTNRQLEDHGSPRRGPHHIQNQRLLQPRRRANSRSPFGPQARSKLFTRSQRGSIGAPGHNNELRQHRQPRRRCRRRACARPDADPIAPAYSKRGVVAPGRGRAPSRGLAVRRQR